MTGYIALAMILAYGPLGYAQGGGLQQCKRVAEQAQSERGKCKSAFTPAEGRANQLMNQVAASNLTQRDQYVALNMASKHSAQAYMGIEPVCKQELSQCADACNKVSNPQEASKAKDLKQSCFATIHQTLADAKVRIGAASSYSNTTAAQANKAAADGTEEVQGAGQDRFMGAKVQKTMGQCAPGFCWNRCVDGCRTCPGGYEVNGSIARPEPGCF